MGSVYLARQPNIGKKVAVKVLHDHLHHEESIVDRFFTEARVVNSIGHPHIVDVLDCDAVELDGARTYYMLMEYLPGRSLRDVLKANGAISPARTVAIIAQILDALAAAHSRGVIHRDIKPDNIFLVTRREGGDFVKLLDFGIAKLLDQSVDGRRTATGVVIGTTAYMAPEQLKASSNLDHRADLFAVGVVMFEMLVGRRPTFDELANQTFAQALSGVVGVGELTEVLTRALEMTPSRRYQSAGELRDALLSSSATTPDVAVATAARPLPQPKTPFRPTMPTVQAHRLSEVDNEEPATIARRLPLWLLAAVAAVAGTALAFVFVGSNEQEQAAHGMTDAGSQVAPDAAAVASPIFDAVTPSDDAGVAASTADASQPHRVTISSSPVGAVIFADGKRIGTSPQEILVPEDESLSIDVQKRGFITESMVLDRTSPADAHIELRRKRRSVPRDAKPSDDRSNGKTIGDTVIPPDFD